MKLSRDMWFLAPEVAVGQPASPASDVWALGCSLFRLRSGYSPFSSLDVWTPRDTATIIASTLGDLPAEWGDVLFDYEGQPTRDPEKGAPFRELEEKRSLRGLVDEIFDQPEGGVVMTGWTWPGSRGRPRSMACSSTGTTKKQTSFRR